MAVKKNVFYTLLIALVVGLLGCQPLRGERSVKQYADDAAITAKVKAKLVQSEEISATQVHVETDQGVVLLSGFVKTAEQARAAARIAQSVEGVKSVRNNLTLYPDVPAKKKASQASGKKVKKVRKSKEQ